MRSPARTAGVFFLALTMAPLAAAQEDASAPHATEPAPQELAAARRLFAEALKDEEAQRYEVALEKFERVRAVKDTAPVRYRIGTCEEGLGKLHQALASYESAVNARIPDADVTTAARERIAALTRRMAQLTLRLSTHAAADAIVEIDGEPIATADLGRPIWLEAGRHFVRGEATGAAPFQTQIALSEGSQTSLGVLLDPRGVAAPSTPDAPFAAPPSPPRDAPPTSSGGGRTTGFVLIGAGAALGVGALVSLILRDDAVASIKDACPGGVCSPARDSDATSTRNRALVEGPLAVGLAIGGVAAAGIGTYLLVHQSARSALVASPLVTAHGGGLALGGTFR